MVNASCHDILRLTESARYGSSSSGVLPENDPATSPPVWRAMVTVLSPRLNPRSALTGSQPILASTSSFSATTTRQVLPKVALSVLCGKNPATLRRYSLQKRPTDVFG